MLSPLPVWLNSTCSLPVSCYSDYGDLDDKYKDGSREPPAYTQKYRDDGGVCEVCQVSKYSFGFSYDCATSKTADIIDSLGCDPVKVVALELL